MQSAVFVVFLRMDRSCCLVACLFSGRSAEFSGTGTSPYAFINFLSCQQSRVRHWPWYIRYRLAFPGILLCSFVHLSQAFCELMLVALQLAVVWGRPARGLLAFLVAVVGIVGYKCHNYTYTWFFGAAVFTRDSDQHIRQGTW